MLDDFYSLSFMYRCICRCMPLWNTTCSHSNRGRCIDVQCCNTNSCFDDGIVFFFDLFATADWRRECLQSDSRQDVMLMATALFPTARSKTQASDSGNTRRRSSAAENTRRGSSSGCARRSSASDSARRSSSASEHSFTMGNSQSNVSSNVL